MKYHPPPNLAVIRGDGDAGVIDKKTLSKTISDYLIISVCPSLALTPKAKKAAFYFKKAACEKDFNFFWWILFDQRHFAPLFKSACLQVV